MIENIPVIDASMFAHDKHEQLDKDIGNAARNLGFLILTNLPSFEPEELEKKITAVFELETNDQYKLMKQSSNSANPNRYRGMFFSNSGTTSSERPRGYEIGPDICYPLHKNNEVDILREATPFPDVEKLPEWKDAAAKWFKTVQRLGIKILASLARSNGFEESSFAIDEANSISTMRILHYPTFDFEEKLNEINYPLVNHRQKNFVQTTGGHVDSGLITLLYQCNEPGLQAKTISGEWVNVPVIKNSLVINFGGLLERVTGGLIRATEHRVLSTGKKRFSIPFFFEPDADQVISAVPGAPVFQPFYYGDYLWTKATKFPPNIGLEHLRENRGEFIDPIER
ncbi:MAG: isopenicillin N synthase family oxygenase [Rhodobacteraceae bacterium]|nr:isopenicillin N synthase family oxygenase [Paracoccaceae bacterium]